jgi:hypothetical protein
VLLAALCVSFFRAGAFAAEPGSLTIDPALVRGPADAPVTIVEFADYQ